MSALSTRRGDQIGGLMEALSVGVGEAPTIADSSAFVTAPADPVAGSCDGADEGRCARKAMLEELRRECGSEEEFDTARTRPIWTEVDACSSSSSVDGPRRTELEVIRVENREYFQRLVVANAPEWLTSTRARKLRESWCFRADESPFFWDFEGRLEAGRRLGGGGQAEIYEALYDGHATEYVVKVFRSDSSLVDLQRLWVSESGRATKGYKQGSLAHLRNCFCVLNGTLLRDGRFAFVMKRYWGDLRKLIDLQIVKDVETHQNPPFPLSTTVWMMMQVARGMKTLHYYGILHRDLKAANVLLGNNIEDFLHEERNKIIKLMNCDVVGIADFETPEGVIGTGFWRAPEILHALKSRVRNIHLDANIWTEKVDVYGYAMTCYEVLTGCIPFHNRAPNDYDGVIGGERPPLPDYVDPEIQELVRRCWHSDPSMRPTFKEVLNYLVAFLLNILEVSSRIPEDERDAEAVKFAEVMLFVYGSDDDSDAWSLLLNQRDRRG